MAKGSLTAWAGAIESLLFAYMLFHKLDGARLVGPTINITVTREPVQSKTPIPF
jgi:hypothetical protein